MDRLKHKNEQLGKALITLEKAVMAIKKYEHGMLRDAQNDAYEEDYRIHRDSVIQRFEYTVDLFWKFIKEYLEVAQALQGLKTPGEVVRTAFSIKLIDEEEAEKILEMIKSRNITSHMYVEEIAEQLKRVIPGYYEVLRGIVDRMSRT